MSAVLTLIAAMMLVPQSSNPHRDPADFQPPINRGQGIIEKNNDTHELEQNEKQTSPKPETRIDRTRIRRDAEELSRLAQSVSNEVADTANGTVPKDLSGNLKKLEKLSKQLREELKL